MAAKANGMAPHEKSEYYESFKDLATKHTVRDNQIFSVSDKNR